MNPEPGTTKKKKKLIHCHFDEQRRVAENLGLYIVICEQCIHDKNFSYDSDLDEYLDSYALILHNDKDLAHDK